MELIVRTAHGTADVSVEMLDESARLGDVISAVTGQATPGTAQVDGRVVNTADSIETCGVVAGSVVDTTLDGPADNSNPPVTVLRQLTGPGAGRAVPLTPGRYRIGPGRRQQADELAAGAADATAFELEVTPAGKNAEPKVTVSPSSDSTMPLVLGHDPVQRSTSWRGRPLASDGRVFRLEPTSTLATTTTTGVSWAPSTAGFMIHNRPPGRATHDRTIAGAIDDAIARAPRLWHERQSTGHLLVDIGLVPTTVGAYDADQNGIEPISIDLSEDRVIALAGPRVDTDALARSVMLDLATRYGPADVDIVVATTPATLSDWDWAKWLPHTRRGHSVGLLTNELEMAALSDRTLERSTLFVVTDDELWNAATSPLRTFVLNPPKHASFIVLTGSRITAPSNAATLVDLDGQRPGHATLERVVRHSVALELFVPLIDLPTTTNAVRRLAPLIDPDRADLDAQEHAPVELDDIILLDDAPHRWNTTLGAPGNPVEMGIGARAGTRVAVDLGIDASVIVTGSSIKEAIDVANVLVLSAAAVWSPTEASILIVDHRPVHGTKALGELPHYVGTFTDRDRSSVSMLLERLRSDLLGDRPSASRLMIVISSAAETELATPGLVDELAEIAAASVGVHLIVSTALPLASLSASLRDVCPIRIAVDRYGGVRRATVSDQHSSRRTAFSPHDDTPTTWAAPITVRPFVFGRQPTALERLIDRGTHDSVERSDGSAYRAATTLAELARQQQLPNAAAVLPTPLPERVLASRLWSAHHGDGIPLGLSDSPSSDGHDPYWWQPGPGGSRLFVGTARSGVRGVLDVLLVGIDRFSTDDVELYVIESHDRRRTQIARLPHVAGVASPSQDADVDKLLGDIEAAMAERIALDSFRLHDHRSILLMVRDVERLSRVGVDAMSHIMRAGARVGVNVVVVAARPGHIDPLIEACEHVVVGAMSNGEHYAELGVEHAASVAGGAGRAELVGGPLIQLAELDSPFDKVLTALLGLIDSEATSGRDDGAPR